MLLESRPDLGPTWKVDLGGTSTERRMLAYSLQGLVNRTEARLYLEDPGDGGGGAVLDRYVDRGLVDLEGTIDVDGALDRFASEASGYVVADPAEWWSWHEAMVVASLEGGIVAAPTDVADLQARGLTEIADVGDRYPDAVSAWEGMAADYGDRLPSDTLAIVRPGNQLWDFVYQQGILPVYTRPSDPSWPAVSAMFDDVPDGSPVYGYLSATGEEEALAVAELAANELTLIPTDTTRNLSFHPAVGHRPRAGADARARRRRRAPLRRHDARRGGGRERRRQHERAAQPLRASVQLGLAAPRRPPDRVVDRPRPRGAGPGHVGHLRPRGHRPRRAGGHDRVGLRRARRCWPTPARSTTSPSASMDELGMTTFWSLGGGLDFPEAAHWDDVEAAARDGVPGRRARRLRRRRGARLPQPHRPAGVHVAVGRTARPPPICAGHLDDLLATPADERPAVSFLSATNWTNPVDDLIEVLGPTESEGVRFLTPAEAAACMPPPDDVDEPDPVDRACLPHGEITETGIGLVSSSMANDIEARPTPFDLPATVDAPVGAAPGDTLDYTATVEVDLGAFATRILEERVRPIVAAADPAVAETAWVSMAFADLVTRLRLPDDVVPVGEPTVTSTGPVPAAAWGDGHLELAFPDLATDSRDPGEPFEVSLAWSARCSRRRRRPRRRRHDRPAHLRPGAGGRSRPRRRAPGRRRRGRAGTATATRPRSWRAPRWRHRTATGATRPAS
ncbi:MAG: GxGYxYP family putative glycoside hydrolase [Acidimicrobiia bacterium]|nr:GxGYxYP family putative glycoside hydrolase [Acidimicrobiia bacterium]